MGFKIPSFDLNYLENFKEEIIPLEGLDLEALKAKKFFPFFIDGKLNLIISRSEDILLVDFIEKITGKTVSEIFLADIDIINELIQKYYESPEDEIGEEEEQDITDIDILKDLASEAPIVRLVNKIIRDALEARATDIHLEPQKDGLHIRYRIDGILHEVARHPKKLIAPIISRIKLMAKLNIAEHRLPQDGRILFRSAGKNLDIRVSVLPTVHGEGIVLRLLVQEKRVLNLEGLGMFSDHLDTFLQLISYPNGIILVTGPTGSGKTTTLYAAISNLNKPDRKIITIEDPVEYQIPGILQIQVKPEIGLTFAAAIRSILRHDPDIILVGEIRDIETAEIAIQAALTGHLVFSTLHTNDAIGAIARLSEMGIEPYLISASTIGLLAQRLVRRLCPKCRKRIEPPQEFIEAYKEAFKELPEEIIYYKPIGCNFCSNTGYRGRLAIYEIIPIDSKIRKYIVEEKSEDEIRSYAREKKYLSLFQDGMRKVAKGLTTFEEILRVTK